MKSSHTGHDWLFIWTVFDPDELKITPPGTPLSFHAIGVVRAQITWRG